MAATRFAISIRNGDTFGSQILGDDLLDIEKQAAPMKVRR
jgi:hypothetical protein